MARSLCFAAVCMLASTAQGSLRSGGPLLAGLQAASHQSDGIGNEITNQAISELQSEAGEVQPPGETSEAGSGSGGAAASGGSSAAPIAPFGKEDTAQELQAHAARTQDTLVDAVENAEVAEIKRAVFRALTRLRAAEIKEFDTIARLETQAIDEYNDGHHYRAENPLEYLHGSEAEVAADAVFGQPSGNAPAPEISLGQIVEHLRGGVNEHKESIPTVSHIEQNLAQLTKAADVTKHSRSEQNDTTEGVVATLRELLSKYLKDLVEHNVHDQAHIDYKWRMLKDGVHSEAGRAHGKILLVKTGWCDGRDELDESKGKMRDVYKYLVAVHQKFKRLSAVIRPVRPPKNGLPLPDSDISEVKQAIRKFKRTKPIYEKRARDYQDSLKKFLDAKDKHSTARQRWKAELELESKGVTGNCTTATREYEDAKREVKCNVKSRHKSYVSVQKLMCYVKHIRDPATGNRCAAEKHRAADWKEHKDIVYKDLPLCKALQDLQAELGPKDWKPNGDQCAALKSVNECLSTN